jgi:hypothetical protein
VNILDEMGVVRDHVVARFCAGLVLGDIAIAKRRVGEGANLALPRREASAAAGPLQNLGAFEFRDHPLHLHEQVSFGRFGRGDVVQENDLDFVAAKLLQEQRLVDVPAGQPIGRVHVEPIDAATVGQIAQPFECRPHQGAAAIALVQKTEFLSERLAVGADALSQRRHLTLDGRLFRLPLRADACIQGDATMVVHDVKRSLLPG